MKKQDKTKNVLKFKKKKISNLEIIKGGINHGDDGDTSGDTLTLRRTEGDDRY